MDNVLNGRGTADSTVRFGEWALDTRSGSLLHGDKPAQTLRPKTASVLAELLATPGRLVTREALLDRVWPGVTVTDDSVTQCIAEIRRALGEDGRWLRTAPRRGYVLDATAALTGPAVTVPAAQDPDIGTRMGRDTGPAMPQPAPALRATPPWRLAAALSTGLIVVAIGIAELGRLTRDVGKDAQKLVLQGRSVFYGPGERRAAWLQARALFLRAHDVALESPDPDAWAVFTYTNMVSSGFSDDPARDLAEASRLADRAVLHGSAAPLAWAARASVYRIQRRPAEALDAYRRSVSLDPAQLPAKANAGWMLVLLGRPQEALEPIEAVLAATPRDHPFRPNWQCYLGIAQFHAGVGDFGAEHLRSVSNSDPNDTSCAPAVERTLYLAAALALGGDNASARALVSASRGGSPGMTIEGLRKLASSDDPNYLQQREMLFRGLSLAGF